MSIVSINLGTTGTQTGDTVRQGFNKSNGNFTDHENRVAALEALILDTPIDGKGTAIVKIDVDEGAPALRIQTSTGSVWVIEGLLLV